MRSKMGVSLLLPVLLCLLAIGYGYPEDRGIKEEKSDTQAGLEQQNTKEPPQVPEAQTDAALEQIFGNPQSAGGSSFESLPRDCRCVDYYLCTDNNTLNEDGGGLIDIRLKDGECLHYLQTCCKEQYIILPKPPAAQQLRPKNKCGFRNRDGLGFRITGSNNEAEYGEFPWMIAVLQNAETSNTPGQTTNVYQCGGSLIHPQVVLTGAHCVNGKSDLLVRAGEWDTQTKNELYPNVDLKVSEVIIHEQFNHRSLINDAALLILESPIDMTLENVALICLPEASENMDDRDCVATGWGKDQFGKEGRYQVILKRVDLPTVPRVPCLEALRRTRLGQHFKLHETFICAGGKTDRDTCKGDGGSPLACPSKKDPDVYVQAGIVAWGIGCGTETPSVYVNVPHFINWIYNKLQERDISLEPFFDNANNTDE